MHRHHVLSSSTSKHLVLLSGIELIGIVILTLNELYTLRTPSNRYQCFFFPVNLKKVPVNILEKVHVNLLSLPVNIFEKLAREPEKVPVNVS